MSPIDRIIVDMYYAGIQRTRRVLVGARVCSGRIHDPGASTVADVNAMYTLADDDNTGSYQHTPIIRGGQGRSDAELREWGEMLHVVCKWLVIAAALVSLALIAVGVV